VNWNRRELLDRCLASLSRQRARRFEVVLVDNGSSDGSVEMATSRYSCDPAYTLIVVRNRENFGFCKANNQGIERARGEFIALLNNDAEAEPDWLASLLSAFEGRPEIGMAASKILVHEDPEIIDKAGHQIYLDGQNWGRGHGEPDVGQFEEIEETLWPDGCAAMYRRAMLDRIGGFDEDLFAYGDDAELGLRGRIAGWGCLYIPTAVVRHHRGSTLGKLSMRRVELIERNRVLLALKHFPWSFLCLNGVYFIARLGAGVMAASKGQGEPGLFPGWRGKLKLARAICSADWQALQMAPSTLRKRWAFRPMRKLTSAQLKSLLLRHRVPLSKMMGGSEV
jgi:GT2 family glycosyltransferase